MVSYLHAGEFREIVNLFVGKCNDSVAFFGHTLDAFFHFPSIDRYNLPINFHVLAGFNNDFDTTFMQKNFFSVLLN